MASPLAEFLASQSVPQEKINELLDMLEEYRSDYAILQSKYCAAVQEQRILSELTTAKHAQWQVSSRHCKRLPISDTPLAVKQEPSAKRVKREPSDTGGCDVECWCFECCLWGEMELDKSHGFSQDLEATRIKIKDTRQQIRYYWRSGKISTSVSSQRRILDDHELDSLII